MLKWQKYILGFFSILITIVSLYGIIYFQYTVGTPFDFSFLPSNKTFLFYSSLVVFWVSIFLFVSSILMIILTIIYPKKEKQFLLSSTKPNSLAIQQKALESIILVKANEQKFFEEVTTKVKVKTKKRKITARIFGSLKNVPELPSKSRLFMNDLQEDIETILGLESENIRLKLILKPNKKKKKPGDNKKRVM